MEEVLVSGIGASSIFEESDYFLMMFLILKQHFFLILFKLHKGCIRTNKEKQPSHEYLVSYP